MYIKENLLFLFQNFEYQTLLYVFGLLKVWNQIENIQKGGIVVC